MTAHQHPRLVPDKRILSVLVLNRPGVLARIASLFARRDYSIHSLAVAPGERDGLSRITIVVAVEKSTLEQMVKQLFKLIDVVRISEIDPHTSTTQELLLVAVRSKVDLRGQVLDLVKIFEGKVVSLVGDSLLISLTTSSSRIDDFLELLDSFEVLQVQRTGLIGLSAPQ